MKHDFYKEQAEASLYQQKQLARQSSRYTLWRTICFFAIVFCFAAGYDGHTAGTIVGLLLILLFARLIRQHNRLHQQEVLLASQLKVTEDYLARFDNTWHNFPQTGAEFMRESRPQDTDLYIFGPHSLYQYLCAARTKEGRCRLANALAVSPPPAHLIRLRQQSVKELLEQPRFCIELEALGRLLPDNHDTAPLLAELKRGSHQHFRYGLQRVAFILPLLTATALLLTGLNLIDWGLPTLLVMGQFALAMALHRRNQAILAPLQGLNNEMHLYQLIFARLEEKSFTSTRLEKIQRTLQGGASQSLAELAGLSARVNACRNLFFFVLANALLLWDCHNAHRFARWQDNAANRLPQWLDCWTEFEVCLSLAMVGHTREKYTFPQAITEGPTLKVTELFPLLLPADKAVANDTSLTAETRIITGSNMSGKTTYMRTLASSLVLAYAGAPVCAQEFIFSPLNIFTSIQVHDDQSQGISTFYAELLRIKQMVDFSQKKEPMLICIDEIFKGTNSADRIIGAREAISRLTRPYCLTLVSTHDFELCDIASPNEVPVTNFHFAEYYEGNEIKFDYKIKPGRCKTTNAQYLLKMAGIL